MHKIPLLIQGGVDSSIDGAGVVSNYKRKELE